MRSINILDCTLRDGGFHNDWVFHNDIVHEYLKAMSVSGVDVVEIGYRSKPKSREGKGVFANIQDYHIQDLPLPAGLLYAIMLDARDFSDSYRTARNEVNRILLRKDESSIDIVRIATNVNDIDKAISLVESVARLGYRVCVNLMQVDVQRLDILQSSCHAIARQDGMEVLYFADSFGGMMPSDISKVLRVIKNEWPGDIGFHGHNNKGMALMNAMEAIKQDVRWIDATVLGMGRGAGNVQTECLVRECGRRQSIMEFEALNRLAVEYFEPLKDQYRWGPDFYYFLSGDYRIHPLYIQKLLSLRNVDGSVKLKSIALLSKEDASKFQEELLKVSIQRAIAEMVEGEKN